MAGDILAFAVMYLVFGVLAASFYRSTTNDLDKNNKARGWLLLWPLMLAGLLLHWLVWVINGENY